MAQKLLLYYITDRVAFEGDERTRHLRLLDKIAEAAKHGVDYIQLREKDLSGRELENLAREGMQIIWTNSEARSEESFSKTRLLINSRTDVALAVGAQGVHLRSDDVSPADVRKVWHMSRNPDLNDPIISVACHSIEEVSQAAASDANLAVFAPVFEKKTYLAARATGLDALQQACRCKIPVFALGGVTLENAESCRQAGAAGIAGIRLFQENDIGVVVRAMRG